MRHRGAPQGYVPAGDPDGLFMEVCTRISRIHEESVWVSGRNIIFVIFLCTPMVLYIGETGRMLRERTGEHLRAITRNPPGFPVAEHFNQPGHELDDMVVCCVKQCRGTNDARRRDEMRLIFHLGTLRPHGLNVDFIF